LTLRVGSSLLALLRGEILQFLTLWLQALSFALERNLRQFDQLAMFLPATYPCPTSPLIPLDVSASLNAFHLAALLRSISETPLEPTELQRLGGVLNIYEFSTFPPSRLAFLSLTEPPSPAQAAEFSRPYPPHHLMQLLFRQVRGLIERAGQ
jgi:hypothetical protein